MSIPAGGCFLLVKLMFASLAKMACADDARIASQDPHRSWMAAGPGRTQKMLGARVILSHLGGEPILV